MDVLLTDDIAALAVTALAATITTGSTPALSTCHTAASRGSLGLAGRRAAMLARRRLGQVGSAPGGRRHQELRMRMTDQYPTALSIPQLVNGSSTKKILFKNSSSMVHCSCVFCHLLALEPAAIALLLTLPSL